MKTAVPLELSKEETEQMATLIDILDCNHQTTVTLERTIDAGVDQPKTCASVDNDRLLLSPFSTELEKLKQYRKLFFQDELLDNLTGYESALLEVRLRCSALARAART